MLEHYTVPFFARHWRLCLMAKNTTAIMTTASTPAITPPATAPADTDVHCKLSEPEMFHKRCLKASNLKITVEIQIVHRYIHIIIFWNIILQKLLIVGKVSYVIILLNWQRIIFLAFYWCFDWKVFVYRILYLKACFFVKRNQFYES